MTQPQDQNPHAPQQGQPNQPPYGQGSANPYGQPGTTPQAQPYGQPSATPPAQPYGQPAAPANPGMPYGDVYVSQYAQTPVPVKKKRSGMITFLVGVLLGLVGGGLFTVGAQQAAKPMVEQMQSNSHALAGGKGSIDLTAGSPTVIMRRGPQTTTLPICTVTGPTGPVAVTTTQQHSEINGESVDAVGTFIPTETGTHKIECTGGDGKGTISVMSVPMPGKGTLTLMAVGGGMFVLGIPVTLIGLILWIVQARRKN